MTPRPTVDLLCPNCGLMNYCWDLPRPHEHSYCVECGADLFPDPPARDPLRFAGSHELEAGAQRFRELLAAKNKPKP